MTITVRLDKGLENLVASAAQREGLTKSDLIRQCLEQYFNKYALSRTPWEIGKDLFGRVGSGRSDLSRQRRRILSEKVHAKKSRRGRGSSRRPV